MAYPIRMQAQTAALGATESSSDRAKAVAALQSMRRSLKKWLKLRRTMDAYVVGKHQAPRWFRNPGAKPLPPSVAALNLKQDRFHVEQDLANTVFSLLVESGADPQSLPQPNVAVDSDAAVKIAEVAVAGRAPEEASSAQAQGIVWFVLAIPVAGVVLVLSQLIKSKADTAIEMERLRLVEAGAITDSGFWLKVASVGVVAWLLWDKVGLKEKIKLT